MLRGEDLGLALSLQSPRCPSSEMLNSKGILGIDQNSHITKEIHISHRAFWGELFHSLFHIHDTTHTVALLHLLKGSVDGRQRLAVSDELVHLELAIEVVVHQPRQLCATLDATKGTALPHTTSDQLEWPSRDLLAGGGNTNYNTLTPALVAGLESGTHDANVSCAVEGVVATAVRHLDQVLLDRLARELGGVHEVGGSELAGPGLLAVVDVHGDDHAGLVLDGTLHHRQTDTARTEDSHIGALLNLGGHHGSTVSGGDTAAKQAGAVGGDLRGHRDHRDVGDDGVLGEGRSAHEVQDVLTARLEARGAVGHDTLALGSTDLAAQVGLARLAELALTAFRGAVRVSDGSEETQKGLDDVLEGDHIVAGLYRGDALANGLDNSSTLVSQDDGESTLGILAGERVGI